MAAEEDSPRRFPKLSDTNWATWRLQMEAELIRKGLWSVIEITVDPLDKDGNSKDESTISAEFQTKLGKRKSDSLDKARAEILLSVEESQLSHCIDRDPREIWNTLESVHQARGFSTSLSLRRKFLTAKKEDSQSMQAWIARIKKEAFLLKHAGVVVSDLDLILALTLGLPDDFDMLITVFDSTPPDQLTLESVINRLINEEMRQRSHNGNGNANEVLTVTTQPRKKQVDVTKITCYFCDKRGHFKSDCPARKEWEKKKKEHVYAVNCEDSDDDSDWAC